MDKKEEIPKKTIYRLSLYSRCLRRLIDKGIETVSSSALAAAAGVKSSQLRKDLAYFGQFGTRGLGYPVEGLQETIRLVLGRENLQPVILVGAGNLGRALLRYDGFRKEGFSVLAAFDLDPGKAPANLPCPVLEQEKMVSFITENEVKMAILCVPAEQGQGVANELVSSGVQGILNFSPTILSVPEHIVVSNVDLAMELENLSFFIG